MRFTVAINREAGSYVARCLEIDVASQGSSVEEARDNLREALQLYFEDTSLPAKMEPTTIVFVDFTA